MSYEPPPQRPSFNPPPDPGYAAADYDQRQAGQSWAQQPPYYPPTQQQFYPPQQPPKKKRHWVRNTFLGLAGFIVLIVIISVAANAGAARAHQRQAAARHLQTRRQPRRKSQDRHSGTGRKIPVHHHICLACQVGWRHR